MANRRQVKCINKPERDNRHERITHIGGDGWKLSSEQAIAAINAGTDEFYVSVGGNEVKVVVAEREGREYLKSEADDAEPNNLLSLPECVSGGGGDSVRHENRPVDPPGPPPGVPRRDRHDRPAQPDRGHA